MIVPRREPFYIRVGRQHGMWVEGDQAHLANLWDFEVRQHLPGKIFVRKPAIPESYRLPGDLSFAIALEKDVHRSQHRERDPTDHVSFRSVVEPTFFDPSGIAEFLRHDFNPDYP